MIKSDPKQRKIVFKYLQIYTFMSYELHILWYIHLILDHKTKGTFGFQWHAKIGN